MSVTISQFISPLGLFFFFFDIIMNSYILKSSNVLRDFPGDSESKESACNAGDSGSIPGSGRSPGEGNGNPLYHSCLENFMDRGTWQAIVHKIPKTQTRLTNTHITHNVLRPCGF